MLLSSVRLQLLIGTTDPAPASLLLTEALQSAEVNHRDDGPSGFQITFQTGRGARDARLDHPLLTSPFLRPFNRVILIAHFGPWPRVLIDGFITHQQLAPSMEPGASTLVVTGEDVGVILSLEERTYPSPQQSPDEIVSSILGRPAYAELGLVPRVTAPPQRERPGPNDRRPVMHGNDRDYVTELARRYGYVFRVLPGDAPRSNVAYWGPPIPQGDPQRALSVNLGAETNVDAIDFAYDSLAPAVVYGKASDPRARQPVGVESSQQSRRPQLASQPALTALPRQRRALLSEAAGRTPAELIAEAQERTDASQERVLTAQGTLDAARYGDALRPYALVDLRGAGVSFSGTYYVSSVRHSLRRGEYKQQFTLARQGTGALSTRVRT